MSVLVLVVACLGMSPDVVRRATHGDELDDSSNSRKLTTPSKDKETPSPRTSPTKLLSRKVLSVRRPIVPKTPPDPAERDVRAGADGQISVAFHGQPWGAVLSWLADRSGAALRCETEPRGYVDLLVTEPRSVEEIRDCLNAMLLGRGYTLVRKGNVLTLLTLKSLSLQAVPQVAVRDLDNLGRYEFATVLFDLTRLAAATVAAEIRPTLGRNARIEFLKSVNRLAVLDTGENLRHVRDLLIDEQAHVKNASVFRVFRLRYVRADDATEIIRRLVGLQSDVPKEPRRQGPYVRRESETNRPAIALAIDGRRNALLASAPAACMGLIERAVALIDVPHSASSPSALDLEARTYRLSTIEPSCLLRLVTSVGGFDKRLRVAVDGRNNSLVVTAPRVDHLAISSLIAKIDGAARHTEVVDLCTLQAVEVATMIERLLRGGDRDAAVGRRLSGSRKATENDGLLVEADPIGNRLLLRASPEELAEIYVLLSKLGERRVDEQASALAASPKRRINALGVPD